MKKTISPQENKCRKLERLLERELRKDLEVIFNNIIGSKERGYQSSNRIK